MLEPNTVTTFIDLKSEWQHSVTSCTLPDLTWRILSTSELYAGIITIWSP